MSPLIGLFNHLQAVALIFSIVLMGVLYITALMLLPLLYDDLIRSSKVSLINEGIGKGGGSAKLGTNNNIFL